MKSSHRVTVMGRELQVRSSASAATVDEVARYINDTAARVAESVKSGDTQLVTLLTLLNIAEEYMSLRQQAQDVVSRLVQQVDNALE